MLMKCYSILQGIWSVPNPSDTLTGRVQLPYVCKHLSATILGVILNISNSELCMSRTTGMLQRDVNNSRISKISILPIAGKISLYFCNKLPSWRPFRPHSYFIFIFVET